jgi:hypothetical protein
MNSFASGLLRRLPILLLVIVLAACSADSEELLRVTSPDSKVDAVLIRTGGPTTVGFSFKLFVVPRGVHPSKSGELLLADRVKNLTAVWQSPKRLELRYDEARIYSFSNFWHSKDIDDFKYIVELRLVPTGPSQLGSAGQ